MLGSLCILVMLMMYITLECSGFPLFNSTNITLFGQKFVNMFGLGYWGTQSVTLL